MNLVLIKQACQDYTNPLPQCLVLPLHIILMEKLFNPTPSSRFSQSPIILYLRLHLGAQEKPPSEYKFWSTQPVPKLNEVNILHQNIPREINPFN